MWDDITKDQASEIISLLKEIRIYTGLSAGLHYDPATDELVTYKKLSERYPDKYPPLELGRLGDRP